MNGSYQIGAIVFYRRQPKFKIAAYKPSSQVVEHFLQEKKQSKGHNSWHL